jgi:prepilin-type N-terminal cleavage/methylation domain-containing protein
MRNNKAQKGFSLIELLIVVAIILIIAAIAIPNLIRSRMAANEASAVGSLRTLNTAMIQYATTYGVGFPDTDLSQLGPSAAPDSDGADLVDSLLGAAAPVKSGYSFTYAPGAADSAGNINSYTIEAEPVAPGTSGQRYFFTDQSGVIRADPSAAADANSTPIS